MMNINQGKENLRHGFAELEKNRQAISFLSGNALKVFALFCMFLDHSMKIVVFPYLFENQQELGMDYVQQWYSLWDSHLRQIGSLAFPVFCFLLVEGFTYTKNKGKYLKNLFMFAILSEIFFDFGFFYGDMVANDTIPFYWGYQNIFFTLLLGVGMLCTFDVIEEGNFSSGSKKWLYVGSFLLFSLLAVLLNTDYDKIGIAFILAFYVGRGNVFLQILLFLIPFFLFRSEMFGIYFCGMLLLLVFYNGKRGKYSLKYFFYIFYPVHLFLLFVVQRLL